MTEQLHLNDLYPIIAEVLQSGGEFTFTPSGNSMRPMLYGKNCSVTIKAPIGRLKKYDLPLYRCDDGHFVLHRVIKVLPSGYIMRGDCTIPKEHGITDSHIVGVVTAFSRFGKTCSLSNPLYRIYCRVWTAFPILRRFVMHFGHRD